MKKGYLPEIDLVKGLAIIAILLLHFFTESQKQMFGITLAFFQGIMPLLDLAVPAFVLLMAFNMARALSMKPRGLKEYFKSRAVRLLPAFFIVFAIVAALGILLGLTLKFGEQQLVGYFPIPGAGNYFIPLVFQFVLLFPLLFWIYKKSKVGSLVLLFGLDFAFEAAAFLQFGPVEIIYQYCIARFLALVWIGFFLSERCSEGSKRISKVVQWLPLKVLALFGIASYHIFLVQIVFFSAIGKQLGFTALEKVLLSLAIGILFYYVNKKLLGWMIGKK